MKAYVIQDSFGGSDNLVCVDRPDPVPAHGEVLVRIRAASLNYRDLLVLAGSYNRKMKLPLIPCSDASGEIEALGSGTSRFRVGDRVVLSFFPHWPAWPVPRDPSALRGTFGGPHDGTLAEKIAVLESALVKAPAHLGHEEASTLPCAGVTAWSALVAQGNLRPGETVVVEGTGGVSVFALQLGRIAGARVIVTSKSDEKLERARALGADVLIHYGRAPEWAKEVRAATDGLGADHVLDVGGTQTLGQAIRAVRMGGIVSIIGVLSGSDASIPLSPVLMQNIRLQGVIVGPTVELEALCRAVAQHQLRPIVDRVVPFDRAKEAFVALSKGQHFGKIVISIS